MRHYIMAMCTVKGYESWHATTFTVAFSRDPRSCDANKSAIHAFVDGILIGVTFRGLPEVFQTRRLADRN